MADFASDRPFRYLAQFKARITEKMADKTQHWNIFNGSSDRIRWEGEIAQSNRLIVSQANKGKEWDEFSVTSRQPLAASK